MSGMSRSPDRIRAGFGAMPVTSILFGLSLIGLLGFTACGPPPAARWAGAPDQLLEAWVSVRPDADGRLEPRVEVTVPRRALVFHRKDDLFVSRLDVAVTAVRGPEQVGGGVGHAAVSVTSLAETRSEAAVSVTVPLQVRGTAPVQLIVRAQVPQTVRAWTRELSLVPAALRSAPVVIATVDARGAIDLGLASEAVHLDVMLLRAAGTTDWPAGGVQLHGEVLDAEQRRHRSPLEHVADAPGPDGARRTLSWAAADLPFGRLELQAALHWEAAGETLELAHRPALALVNYHVSLIDDEAWSQHLDWLDGQLTAAVRDSLRTVPVPARTAAWQELWTRLAAATREPVAASQRRHLDRIVTADARYGGFGRGALSDRGRVFVRWGDPDVVETVIDPRLPGAIWEIWLYEDTGRRFHFHDAHGMGDFRLRREDPPTR